MDEALDGSCGPALPLLPGGFKGQGMFIVGQSFWDPGNPAPFHNGLGGKFNILSHAEGSESTIPQYIRSNHETRTV